MSLDLQTTHNGTCVSGRSVGSTVYFSVIDYSTDSTCCRECVTLPLKCGGELKMTWNRLGAQEALESAYVDTWMPAGAGSVFSFLPRINKNQSSVNGHRVYSDQGTVYFNNADLVQAQLPWVASQTSTYFTTYEQVSGTYFEYFGGGLSTSDWRYGRVNRRYDTHGCAVGYNYSANAQGKALLRSLSGDLGGGLTPYFFYADENIDATRFAPINKLYVHNPSNPSSSRTVYYEYHTYQDVVTLSAYPYLSRIVNPSSCVDSYDPIVPFNDITDAYQIKRDVDPEGYQTYFNYTAGEMSRVDEPEGRVTYYEYPSIGETRQIQKGRSPRFLLYGLNAVGDRIGQVTQHTDPLNQSVYFVYDETLARMTKKIDPNGNLTYYEYMGGSAGNKYALTRMVSAFNGAVTYLGYDPGSYDMTKKVGPRQTASFSHTTYYRYDAARDRVAMVDALGNTTLYGDDSLGRLARERDARGNATYYFYGASAGYLDVTIDAALNVSYFGYDAFRNKTADVSPRWKESNFAAFTSYFIYDDLNRKTKDIDPLGNVTYYDWTSRSDLMATVDAKGTERENTYSGLRLKVRETVTDSAGTLLSDTKDGYDTYKNRTKTLDGLGNATYFFYDQIDQLTVTKDALENSTYYFYDTVGNQTVARDARANSTYFFYDLLSRKTASRNAIGNASYFFYDIGNNQTVGVDPRGNAAYFFYDELDRRSATRDALANPTYFFYDPVGNQSVVRNARFFSTYFGYDVLNRQSRTQDALANTTYFEFDARGNGTRTIDARGNASTSTYDTLDRLKIRQDALLNPTYLFYDAVGNTTHQTDARFNTTYFFHDGLRRATVTRDALAGSTYFFYDLAGNQTVARDARANSTYFGYDAVNRNSKVQDALANTTYFAFDAVGNRVRVTDARLNSSTAAYDAVNRPSAVADGLNNPTYFFYDPAGNQSVVRNARVFSTYFGYDALNRRTVVQDALGNSAYYTYDAVGNQTALIDPLGNTSTSAYDALNRPSLVTDPLGNTTRNTYDEVGNRTRVSRGLAGYGLQAYGITPYGGLDGATTYFFYDSLNRNNITRDALGNATYFYFDPVSNRTVVRNPLVHSTYFGYDALSRMTRIQDALGKTTYFEFDAVGNRTKVLDPNNHATQTRFDALNRTDSIRYADAGSSYFFYDTVGNRVRDLDPLGKATYYGYDAANRAVRIQDALAATLYFEYDGVGNPTRFLDAERASTTLTYDAVDRRTNALYAAAGSVVSASLRSDPYYVYDAASNLVQVGDLWGLHRMGYDAGNRLTQHQFPNGNVVYYRYDARWNISARVYPGSAGTSSCAYDNLDRETRVQAPSGGKTYFSYDSASNLTQRLLGNLVRTDASYDNAERLATWRASKSNGAPLSYFDYARDDKGLITKAVREATYAVYYRYDENDRLAAEIWATVGASPAEVYGYRYAYDVAGNRTKARVNGSDTYYSYDPANQLTVKGSNAVYATPSYYSYDLNGSLLDFIEPSGTTKFAYNPAGLVARIKWKDATSTYFFYDGELRRYGVIEAGSASPNYFIWDGQSLLQKLNADGTVKEEYTNAQTQTPGIAQLVETYRPSESASLKMIYPIMDPRGTITKWVQSDGTTVLASREYDAFGGLVPSSEVGTWPGIFGYQGQAWQELRSGNAAQRLLLSPTRLYDPADGRFLSRDVLRLADATQAPHLVQPYYTFVFNSPVNLVDADGRVATGWTYAPGGGGWGIVTIGRDPANRFSGNAWGVPNTVFTITRHASNMFVYEPVWSQNQGGGGGWGGGFGGGTIAAGGFGAGGAMTMPNAGALINAVLGGLAFLTTCQQTPGGYGCIALGKFRIHASLTHLSVELYNYCPVPAEKDKIDPSRGRWNDARELMRSPDIQQDKWGHYERNHPKATRPWRWFSDHVSIITKSSMSLYATVIYHDATQKEPSKDVWNKRIIPAADKYDYAEQDPAPNILTKWPNSAYNLGWPIAANNSNTFVSVLLQTIPRKVDDYIDDVVAPGNRTPKPVGWPQNQYKAVVGPDDKILSGPPAPASNDQYWPK